MLADFKTGHTVQLLGDASKEALSAPVFSADERYVMANRGHAVLLWAVETGQLLDTIHSGVPVPSPRIFAKAIDKDSKHVITWSWGGPQHWPLLHSAQAIVEYVQSRVPRCLSPKQRRERRLSLTPPRWCQTGMGLEQETDKSQRQPLWPFDSTSEN